MSVLSSKGRHLLWHLRQMLIDCWKGVGCLSLRCLSVQGIVAFSLSFLHDKYLQ